MHELSTVGPRDAAKDQFLTSKRSSNKNQEASLNSPQNGNFEKQWSQHENGRFTFVIGHVLVLLCGRGMQRSWHTCVAYDNYRMCVCVCLSVGSRPVWGLRKFRFRGEMWSLGHCMIHPIVVVTHSHTHTLTVLCM